MPRWDSYLAEGLLQPEWISMIKIGLLRFLLLPVVLSAVMRHPFLAGF